MTFYHFLIGWGIFLIITYVVMACEALMYNKELKDTIRRINEVLTEEEE